MKEAGDDRSSVQLCRVSRSLLSPTFRCERDADAIKGIRARI